MNGYLDDPEATAACTTEDGFLTCGDIVMLDDEGYVHIVDRKKDLIISGGVNVYPREVEEVLATHPAVAEAAVVGVPDDAYGRAGRRAPRAAARRTRWTRRRAPTSRRTAATRLAGYKVPRAVRAIAGALPRNAAGKVLKRDLRVVTI